MLIPAALFGQTHVLFTLSDFNASPATNRSVTVQKLQPFPGNLVTYSSGASGTFYVSNATVGDYDCVILKKGTASEIAFQVTVTATNLGVIGANTNTSVRGVPSYPTSGKSAWTIAASDARYATNGSTGGGGSATNVYLAPGSVRIAVTTNSAGNWSVDLPTGVTNESYASATAYADTVKAAATNKLDTDLRAIIPMTNGFARSQIVNVLDYGAVPHQQTGISEFSYPTNRYSLQDNGAAIQAAINAAYNSRGRSNTVHFPHGVWMVGTNLYIPPGISLSGVGLLHAGDFGSSPNRLDTNAYSVIWMTNSTYSSIVFSNLNTKGSQMSFLEVNGYTNPFAYGSANSVNSMATNTSANLANGPGIYLGNPSTTDWATTAAVGEGYSGDFQAFNVSIVGFKVGTRSTANSLNFFRTHWVACDIGYQTTPLCCGGDQTVFDNCSAAERSNGIGYDFYNNGAARGIAFKSPSDYQIGTWIRGTNFMISVDGGNMEFTASTTRTNFIEAWGSAVLVNMSGTRVQGNNSLTSFINYGEDNYGGLGGGLHGCKLQDFPSFASARSAGIPTNYPCILRTSTYDTGSFEISGGGTEGWRVVTDVWPARGVLDAFPMSSKTQFAPFEMQTTYWGAFAYDNNNLLGTYGKPFIIRGTGSQDFMEIWLAESSTGPLAHRRVMLGDASSSTSAAALNNLTLAGLKSDTITNTSTTTKIIGTDANGKHVGATLSGLTWDGSTLATTGSGGATSNAISIVASNGTSITTSATNLDFWLSGTFKFWQTNRSGHADILGEVIGIPALTGDVTSSGLATTIAANAVALGTDTTGNYVATIADSGASEVTVSGSGSETAAVTLALASSITRDTEIDTIAEVEAIWGRKVATNNATMTASTLIIGDGARGITTTTTGSGVLTALGNTANASGGFLTYDAELAALGGLTSAADKIPYFTGSGTAGLVTIGTGLSFSSGTLSATAATQYWYSNSLAASSISNAFHVKIAGNLEVTGDSSYSNLFATNFFIPGQSNGVAAIQSDGSVKATNTPVVTSVDLGLATDTTLTRSSAGNVAIEGNVVYRAGGTDVPVADGGTGLSSGTSGGVPYFSGSTTIASSAALAASAFVLGGGAGAAPATTTTASGAVTFIGTPSSANLASLLTDESGSGVVPFFSLSGLTAGDGVKWSGSGWTNGPIASGGAPTDADYLVGTANGSLSGEIVVGTSPGGELGGTWASPTIDDGVTVDAWVLGASTATTPASNDNDTSVATSAFVSSSTVTFTGKTFDTDGSGNVLKQNKWIQFICPAYGDGAGAVPQTNTYTTSGLMHYTFSGSAETNANYVVYECMVPFDINTAVDMTARIAFISGGTDADDVTFHVTYALGASGTALPTGTSISTSPIAITKTPTTPASGDVQVTSTTTLTGWAASMTAGTPLLIRVARLNTANDDTARDAYITIGYGSTQ